MIDVVEHVPALAEFMAAVARCLRPGGTLVILCPDAAGLEYTGSAWSFLHRSLEHVTYPSVRCFEFLGARLGLEVVKVWSDGRPHHLRNYRRYSRPRLLRTLLEPDISIVNAYRKLRFSGAQARGVGEELHLFMRKMGAAGQPAALHDEQDAR